jgi:DNA-binding helix-hairpin-helix protein with protein kinase domain
MAEQLRQMQAALESNQAEAQAKMHIEQQKLELEREKFQVKTQIDRELKIAELAQKEGLTIAQLQQKMEEIDRKSILEAQKMASQRDIEGVKAMNHQNELAFKARTGRQGI